MQIGWRWRVPGHSGLYKTKSVCTGNAQKETEQIFNMIFLKKHRAYNYHAEVHYRKNPDRVKLKGTTTKMACKNQTLLSQ